MATQHMTLTIFGPPTPKGTKLTLRVTTLAQWLGYSVPVAAPVSGDFSRCPRSGRRAMGHLARVDQGPEDQGAGRYRPGTARREVVKTFGISLAPESAVLPITATSAGRPASSRRPSWRLRRPHAE